MYVLSTIQALKIAREDNKTQLWRLQLTSSQTQLITWMVVEHDQILRI